MAEQPKPTPTLAEVIRRAIEARLAEVHVCLPGSIESYDKTQRRASVKPMLQRQYVDGDVESMPIINNVPVYFPSGGGASITLPVKKGDGCVLLFSERSLDRYLAQPLVKETETGDVRMHDISDAIAFVGVWPFLAPQAVGASDDTVRISIGVGNKVAIGGPTAELLDILSQTLQALATTTAGGFPLSSAAALALLKTQLDSIKGTLV